MDICDKNLCTGCGACQNICPTNCISLLLDEEGFYKYSINTEECINCNLCLKTCPSLDYNKFIERIEPEAFLCWNFDEKIRLMSSSGGVFSLLAEQILDAKGVVFGASFDEAFHVKHIGVLDKNDLKQLRGSKYIQSHTGDTFKKTKYLLDNGRIVLYSGTPCQIAGLYKILGKDYKNLLTCDVICHGVYSIRVYRDILNYYETKYKSKIADVKFRDKNTGWKNSSVKITFESGTIISEVKNISLLAYGFAAGFTNNKTCSLCKHAVIPRRADLTLGDYGAEDYVNYSKKDIRNGISVMMINSDKGKGYFDLIKNNMYYEQKSIESLLRVQKNIAQPNTLHPQRDEFFGDYKNKTFDQIKKNYLIAPLKHKLIYKVGSERYYFVRSTLKKIIYTLMGKNYVG